MKLYNYLYLVRKKEVNFILSYYTNLSHTGQEKFTSFFRIVYTMQLHSIEEKFVCSMHYAALMLWQNGSTKRSIA